MAKKKEVKNAGRDNQGRGGSTTTGSDTDRDRSREEGNTSGSGVEKLETGESGIEEQIRLGTDDSGNSSESGIAGAKPSGPSDYSGSPDNRDGEGSIDESGSSDREGGREDGRDLKRNKRRRRYPEGSEARSANAARAKVEKDFTQGIPKRVEDQPKRKRRKIGSQTVAKRTFEIVSFFLGPHWELEDTEIRQIGRELDDVREEYPWLDDFFMVRFLERLSPVLSLSIVLLVTIRPRIEMQTEAARKAREAARQRWKDQGNVYNNVSPNVGDTPVNSQPTEDGAPKVNTAQLKFKSIWNQV